MQSTSSEFSIDNSIDNVQQFVYNVNINSIIHWTYIRLQGLTSCVLFT